MDAREYLADPCGSASLAFWKAERVAVPDNMRIVRDDEFDAARFSPWRDERYFKLCRELTDTKAPALPEGYLPADADPAALARHICACYDAEGVTAAELEEYRAHPVYDPSLWLAVAEREGGAIVASGIAELDRRIGEGVLEWIQVSPAHRRRGLGAYIVRELLHRMKNAGAVFATVSGKADSASNPLSLYNACGFGDKVVWHILRK